MMNKVKTINILVITLAVCSFGAINFESDVNFGSSGDWVHTHHYGTSNFEESVYFEDYAYFYKNISLYDNMFVNDNVYIYHDLLVYGNKNFIHPHPEDTTKVIKYISVESGEALTLARGTAKTESGRAEIELPEHFSLVTSDEVPLTVLVTPENAPVCLYTHEKNNKKITVLMKQSDYYDHGDVSFSWQVTGVRDGFEDEDVIVNIDEEMDKDKKEKNISEKRKEYNRRVEKIRKKMMKKNQ